MRTTGFDIVRYGAREKPPSDQTVEDCNILERIAGYTMTSIDRQISLIQSVRYIVKNCIDGCFVECGVWRGGSSMAMALTLLQEGDMERELYLYDTFEGMTPPSATDQTSDGISAQVCFDRNVTKAGGWCVASIEEVQKNMALIGYPNGHIHFIRGPVEETIPKHNPSKEIALLRLDTDWYESTRHELIHLFPLLCKGGIMIIDDYGYWKGSRKAIDEYLGSLEKKFFLHRIDSTGRLLVKC